MAKAHTSDYAKAFAFVFLEGGCSKWQILELRFVHLLYFFLYRQLPALIDLETLHMRNTQRTLSNFPTGLDSLNNLQGEASFQNLSAVDGD